MLKPIDRVAVAVSGGKDSLSLLHILNKIEDKFPRSELIAITIDEGISGYREEAIKIVEDNCFKLGIEHQVYSFMDCYQQSLDEVVKGISARGELTPCSYCGILRRKAFNLAAKEVGATKLVTGHNLDDEIQSMVLNLLRGDVSGLKRVTPIVNEEDNRFIRKVKPLCRLPENEVALYAFLKKIRHQTTVCPYAESSMRNDVRRFLNAIEKEHFGIKYTLFKTFEKIQPYLQGLESNNELNRCERCSEPASGKICRACLIIENIQAIQNKQ